MTRKRCVSFDIEKDASDRTGRCGLNGMLPCGTLSNTTTSEKVLVKDYREHVKVISKSISSPSPRRTTRRLCHVSNSFSSSLTLEIKCLGVLSISCPIVTAAPSFPNGTLKSLANWHMASAASLPHSVFSDESLSLNVSSLRNLITNQQIEFFFVAKVDH